MAKKRLSIKDLIPGEEYAIQVRAVDGGDDSRWSEKHDVNTISDFVGENGQPRKPSPPVLTRWDTTTGVFVAEWGSVTTMDDGSVPAIAYYELRLVSDVGAGPEERIVGHYGVSGSVQRREFTLPALTGAFGKTPGNVYLKVRAVNKSDNVGDWSNELMASIGVPDPPTDAVPPPTAESLNEAVKLRWTPPANMNYVTGYRVYWSTTPDFIPNPMFMSYEGPANEFTLTSGTYEPHYFKIRSYSAWGTESVDLLATGTPKSPYGPDDTPPSVPQIVEPLTMDRSVLQNPKVNISWTHDQTLEVNLDTMAYVIQWRGTTEENWRVSYFDKGDPAVELHSGTIDLPRPFSSYQFKVAALDTVGNYSEFSPIVSLSGSTGPPGVVTNFRASAGLDNIRYDWDESTPSVVYGGHYQIQFRSTNSFPSDTPVEYRTGATSINISGLSDETPYYARIRAVDSDDISGPWSAVLTKSTTGFPVDPTSDGVAPTAPPTSVKAAGGLNYINVSWKQIVNPDPVHYEVHMGTAAGFTVSSATLIGVSSGTSMMVNTTVSGADLVQNTPYHFRVRAVDADGPGPESASVSDVLTQVVSSDLGINMPGENLYYNSSFETDSDGNKLANYWTVYNNSSSTEPHTVTLPAGRDNYGKAQRVTWTGVNSTQKGIVGGGVSILRPKTEYTLSFYARASGGTGFSLHWNTQPLGAYTALTNPTPSSSTWQRYVFRFTTNTTVDPNNVYISVAGHTTANGGWVEFDDMQIEAGNLASAYKEGTVSIAKLATGRLESASIIVDTGGEVKSDNYSFANKTGFLLTESGLNLMSGVVRADTLEANSSFVNDLNVKSLLTIGTGGFIRSTNYNTTNKTGFSLSSAGLDIQSGTIRVGTLIGGTISAPDIRIGLGGKITIDSSGSIQSNNYSSGVSGWRIGWNGTSQGIEMWDSQSKINVNALESSTLTSTIIKIGSNGSIESAGWSSNPVSPVRWKIADTGLTMVGGTITGSTVITNQLKSESSETIDGVTRYKFSISSSGYAEFSGARVYGNMTVGSGANNFVQSAGYGGAYGWKLHGDGVANFMRMNTWNMTVNETATVSNSSGHLIKSGNFAGWGGGAGWGIRGDGHAEFWGGSFAVGNWTGGQIRLQNWGSGESIVQFLLPGNWNAYHYIKANGQNFDVRGAYGGAVTFTADTTVRASLHLAVDYDIWAGRNIGAGNKLEAPILGGDPVHNWLSTGSQTGAGIGASGRLIRLNSSARYKKDIEPLGIEVERVLSLDPKKFKWKNEKEYGTAFHGGFIAEEALDAGLDEFVTYEYDDDGEYVVSGFQYGNFTAAQQIVLREHHKDIKSLQDKIEALEKILTARS